MLSCSQHSRSSRHTADSPFYVMAVSQKAGTHGHYEHLKLKCGMPGTTGQNTLAWYSNIQHCRKKKCTNRRQGTWHKFVVQALWLAIREFWKRFPKGALDLAACNAIFDKDGWGALLLCDGMCDSSKVSNENRSNPLVRQHRYARQDNFWLHGHCGWCHGCPMRVAAEAVSKCD